MVMYANDYESADIAAMLDPAWQLAPQAQRPPQTGCGVLFFRLSRASGEGIGDALAEIGMRPAEYAVLHQLAEAGPLSQQAVAQVPAYPPEQPRRR